VRCWNVRIEVLELRCSDVLPVCVAESSILSCRRGQNNDDGLGFFVDPGLCSSMC